MLTLTFYDLLAKNVDGNGDHAALIEGGNELSYRELSERVEALAGWLADFGIRRGDRVAIQLHKCTEEVVAMFAVARIGAIFVNFHHNWTLRHTAYGLRDCSPRILFADTRRAREIATGKLPETLEHVVVAGDSPDHEHMTAWSDLPSHLRPSDSPAIDKDLAAILYTSGSSGWPKGAMLTHQNLIYSARYAVRHLRNSGEDRILALLPFSFSYGLMQLTTMCLAGGSSVIQRAPMTVDILDTLVAQRITGVAGTPTTWMAVTEELSATPREFPALRYITSSGAPVPTPVLDALPRVFPGVEIHLLYGTTEGLRATCVAPEHYAAKKSSLGTAIPGVEVFVIDEENGVCGPGEEGELVYRSSAVGVGYWGNPAETARKFRACPQLKHVLGDEKVLYSGDTVRLDEDGVFWYVGRKDSLIQVGGSRVSPTEVEDSVYLSSLVKTAVAFGVAEQRQGQVVHVAVSSPDGHPVDEQALWRYCRKNMPPHMVPAVIHVWEGDLPTNGRGKLDRARIAETCMTKTARSPPTARHETHV